MIDINELTIGQMKQLQTIGGCENLDRDFETGEKVLIQTVTHYFSGEVLRESNKFVTLIRAAWVADTGKFSKALKSSEFNEVEICNSSVRVGKGAIIAVHNISELPIDTK